MMTDIFSYRPESIKREIHMCAVKVIVEPFFVVQKYLLKGQSKRPAIDFIIPT